MPPVLLDLFCGAGGAAVGYHRAGFDVIGVDINPQPDYPFPMVVADAMTWPLNRIAAIHASPPCHDHSALRHRTGRDHGTGWMLAATLDRLAAQPVPWVVENVGGADLGGAWSTVCGSSLGLNIWRHRRFASSVLLLVPTCRHDLVPEPVTVTGEGTQGTALRSDGRLHDRKPRSVVHAREVMGIDWMTRRELSQAIPPAYTEYIGAQLLRAVA